MSEFYREPFFWALLVGAGFYFLGSLWFTKGLKWVEDRRLLIYFALALIESRFLLVLPFCDQPRFDLWGWHWVAGGTVFAVGLLFGIPTFLIRPLTPPKPDMRLRTTGFYGIIRNPLYFCEMATYIGLAVMFRSIIGLALTPVFWAFFLLHTLMEEKELEKALGERYLEYKRRVRGRMIPGLPI